MKLQHRRCIDQHAIYYFSTCNNVQKLLLKKASKKHVVKSKLLLEFTLTKIDDNILCVMINNHNLLMGAMQGYVARLPKRKMLKERSRC